MQAGLASGQVRACSIGFQPKVWSHSKQRDGIDFFAIDLMEISAVSLPACPGAVLEGPVKSMKEQRRDTLLRITRECR